MESTTYRSKTSRGILPDLLYEMPEKAIPASIHIAGTLPPADSVIVAVVGSRKSSSYGRDAAFEITRALARAGVVIVSGMAVGIDSVAHKTTLDEGAKTIAVLGSGLAENVIYPKENIRLAHQIISSGGALISEYCVTQKPELWTFPQRNRIIAGIAKATIVIEANAKSGALITARYALDYNRDVLTVPGQIFSEKSEGTNNLIKLGATPITHPSDVLQLLGLEMKNENNNNVAENDEEKLVISALDEEKSMDEIIKITRLTATQVISAASALEIRGMIKSLGGGLYRKI